MKTYKSLRYIDQLALFKLRGIQGISLKVHHSSTRELIELNKQLNTISTLGYYNLKNYAEPYLNNSTKNYENLYFNDLIARYYRDKHLKQAVLHAIEDIETTLNTKIAHVLGEYSPYGYLDFRVWCQRDSKNKFLKNKMMDKFTIESEQANFLKEIIFKIKKSYSKDMQFFTHSTDKVYPPIWLLMNELTLGSTIHIYKLMSKQNKRKISNYFGCKSDELVSWLENINLIRNICCHNGTLCDFKLKTKAKVPTEVKEKKILVKTNSTYTNRLAFQLCIIIKLMSKINPKYSYNDMKKALYSLINNKTTPEYYGFIDKSAIDKLFKINPNDIALNNNLIEY
ncbi:Abi family protein [Lactobacillus sp. PV034]|uniref:Abi family protein n=1 Tax=Lactobacillus sp. PV034 TaxID=2594495 RepID=UPI00223F621D|nr:Abi family protein [Lactobacillus sp. PV034]QNQ81084.1 Abi family protein [Lactobacillus sp. PV034]